MLSVLNQKSDIVELLDYGSLVSPEDLVGLWLFNEGSGNVYDLSENDNIGSATGDVSWVPGKFGMGLRGEGSNDHVNLAKVATESTWSIVFWANQDSGADVDGIICGHTGAGHFIWLYEGNYARVRCAAGDSDFADFTDFTGDHQYVFTGDGTTIRYYRDGVFVNSNVPVGNTEMQISALLGGYSDGSLDFKGRLDLFNIYKRTLSPYEIALIYQEPLCMLQRRRRMIAFEEIAAPGVVQAAGQADSVTSSTAGITRLNRPMAGVADSVSSSTAGIKRGNRPMAGQAASASSSTAGITRGNRAMAGQADSASLSYAGMYRLNRPGAGQADSVTSSYAGMTGGAAASVEEIFRHRRLRHSSTYARRVFRGVF